ncbi:MAG: hypothetical protein ACR2QA_01630 [Solirubrobacteraceae bacterium]
MPANQANLRLEVSIGEVPISGQLTAAGNEPIAFAGWIELVALIERSLAALVNPDDRPATPVDPVPIDIPRRTP